MNRLTDIKIVVIGGGTGSFTLLSGLKNYTYKLTAIVNMADDGGSTGVLRDELGVLPPGDVRQCLVALSETPHLRDLFNYRFLEGTLQGHAFGNLFITALEKMTGSFSEAISVAGEVLNIRGKVVPVTLDDVHLVMEKRDGSQIAKQYKIGNMKFDIGEKRPDLSLKPSGAINPAAAKAINSADLVVIAPGNLYGSLAPSLLVDGMGEVLAKTKAKIIYVCNLVTKPGQTDGFKVHDFADEIERFIGRRVLDGVLYNTKHPNKKLLEKYRRNQEYGVTSDKQILKNKPYLSKGINLISSKLPKIIRGDKIAASRSFFRHDAGVLARHIIKLYKRL